MPVYLTKDDIGKLYTVYARSASEEEYLVSGCFVMYMFASDHDAQAYFEKSMIIDMDGSRVLADSSWKHNNNREVTGVETITHDAPIMLLNVEIDPQVSGNLSHGFYKFLQSGIIGYSSVGVLELSLMELKHEQ